MAGVGRTGKGSAGSDFIATDKIFPGVPYDSSNFNPREKCNSNSGSINNYGDAEQVGSLYAAVTRPCTVFAKGILTYDNTSDKLRVRFVYVRRTLSYVFMSNKNVHIADDTV